ncbi:hypothetical protein [uncultured Mediterranean phage uvMED]|jgi:hypothetical protein|nr:hypothetical protein [uncultured Mediterranean phage uvMED]BAR17744.1 hypothetical protein [uncultured Mediterranean phage uvMED]|tara:strand:- start:28 stop:189 length:162 start_codon:yes stop_codon:yes gene_type:complete
MAIPFIVKGIGLGAGALGIYELGKSKAKKKKATEDKKLNRAIKQHMNAVRHTR